MTEVEKVARAICVEGGYDPDEIMPNDGQRWRYYVPGAEAAIAAIEATPPETPDERQAAIVRALRIDAHCCDCFAYSYYECACGAWGSEPDERSFKRKYVEDVADWIESGEWRK